MVASAAETSTQADVSHQSHDAHLRQHYRHQPSPDDPESSGSEQDDQTSNASSDAMNLRDAGSDEEEDASTWLADPPIGVFIHLVINLCKGPVNNDQDLVDCLLQNQMVMQYQQ